MCACECVHPSSCVRARVRTPPRKSNSTLRAAPGVRLRPCASRLRCGRPPATRASPCAAPPSSSARGRVRQMEQDETDTTDGMGIRRQRNITPTQGARPCPAPSPKAAAILTCARFAWRCASTLAASSILPTAAIAATSRNVGRAPPLLLCDGSAPGEGSAGTSLLLPPPSAGRDGAPCEEKRPAHTGASTSPCVRVEACGVRM